MNKRHEKIILAKKRILEWQWHINKETEKQENLKQISILKLENPDKRGNL